MTHMPNIVRRSGAFFAGIPRSVSAVVTPVFAATLDGQLTPGNLILVGSLVLLAIGIALKVMQRRRGTDVPREDPDLRWSVRTRNRDGARIDAPPWIAPAPLGEQCGFGERFRTALHRHDLHEVRQTQAPALFAIRDERDYAAALDEFDGLVLSEPGTPPGRRFDELVRLIDEYACRRSGYVGPWRGIAVGVTSPARIDTRRKLATAANR